jgi:thiamine kinase-like enzyme
VSPEWLTNALRQSGVLAKGRVVSVEQRANSAFNSAACHLRAIYSADATGNMPRHLFIKRNLAEPWAVRAGAREVAFYQVASAMAPPLSMLVPCYGASFDATSGDSWLLLRDVSETHEGPVTREQSMAGVGVPSDTRLRAIVEALASLHAAWWEHPALGTGALLVSEWYRDHEHFTATSGEFASNWTTLRQTSGATLPAATITLYEAAIMSFPHIWNRLLAERMAAKRHLTISHGDCYLSQFLCPKPDSLDDATYLIDFQGACGDLPAMDLVFLFATFWTPEQRHEHDRERRFLRLYHDALMRHGISGYSWDELVADYRIALAFMLFYPVWDAANGSKRAYWEPKQHCLASAADDWACRELFASVAC